MEVKLDKETVWIVNVKLDRELEITPLNGTKKRREVISW